jgi:hypothetical protein
MIKSLLKFAFLLIAIGCSTASKDSESSTTAAFNEAAADRAAAMPFFPADTFADGRITAVKIDAASAMFFMAELEQHDLSGNGYCLSGIIEQLVEKNAPDLLPNVTFDPEADMCFISCNNHDTMVALAELIHKHLSSKEDMLKVLEWIDKTKLDC